MSDDISKRKRRVHEKLVEKRNEELDQQEVVLDARANYENACRRAEAGEALFGEQTIAARRYLVSVEKLRVLQEWLIDHEADGFLN